MPNPFQQLNNLYAKLQMLPGEVTQMQRLSSEDKTLLRTIGLSASQVKRDLLKDVQIHYDRYNLYHQIERALEHPLVGAATELYGNYCTVFSPLHNSTAWITSESPTYQKELTKLLDRIGLEEKIFDWAYTTGSYGDMFVRINGIPGKGVISISDDEHPLNTSRVDHEGVLIGYYKTPMGQTSASQKLMAPWEYVHFRLLGGKKKRPQFCLRGNTRISTDEDATIEEMADNPDKYVGKLTWSVNPVTLKLEVDTIVAVQKTRLNAQLVRVYFGGNKKYVDCTPDHKFLLQNGKYVEAQYLKVKNSLMPFRIERAGKLSVGWPFEFFEDEEEQVTEVIWLDEREDTYDITTKKNHNFALTNGVFVHNSDPLYSEFRTMHLLTGMDVKQVTTKYGTSLLLNALPSYRRLRLAEDSLLLARLSRGLIRYIWKLKVDSSNMESVGELVDQYSRVLREARAVDTREATANFDSRENPMCLGGDTQISLMDGTNPTIEEMADDPKEYIGKYVLTVNEKTKYLEPKKIKNIRKTRLNTQLVRVHLGWKVGKCVDCTPDHKFMLRDGTYKEAQDLRTREVLMPYYSCLNREEIRNFCSVYDPGRDCTVVKVVWLKEREDTYDIQIDGTPNFPLTAGVFVHNSVIEDIFLPVWGDVGDLSYDKIGGEADIRWIRDIEDLRQQLAAALRTPLPLLGAYLKEATGPLGSQAIEKLDINFARMARKLQRTVRNGIKRICQIHLAYMNMDPDPDLFDVQMPEMSTAEEESLKESLKSGMDVVGQMMDVIDSVMEGDDRKVDKVEILQYLNQKFLKLEDFDLKDFLTSTDMIPECKSRRDRMEHELRVKYLIEKAMNGDDKNKNRVYPKPLLDNMDLVSYVPTTTHTSEGVINKRAVSKLLKRPGAWLGYERSKQIWESKFASCRVIEGEFDKDVEVGGQRVLPFEE